MRSIHYDPERILNGFTEDSLKDLAKRLKRRIRVIKSDIIQDILSPPRGKLEDMVKVWQEINRNLRKELEGFSQEELKIFSLGDTPLEEQFKVSYMFTLSSNPEIKAMGEELYCQAEESKELEKDEEAKAVLAVIMEKVETSVVKESIEDREIKGMQEAKSVMVKPELINRDSIAKMPFKIQGTEENKELQKKIITLEEKLKKMNSDGMRIKDQLEKQKSDWVALKAQWLREKEAAGKYRNRVRELEVERIEKHKEIEILKKKLAQLQYDNLPNVRVEHVDEVDLAAFHGRKALIFAEHDNEVDNRLHTLGIIPIWAMEIDWNRPRRRMSTCQIVLYRMNNEKLKKLDEIRDIARHLNIPCNELLDVK